jgi:predicted  nucleic acid-binding Zn-ribbon protein
MTRTLKTLATVCLGAFLLASAGCENKEAQEALKTCKNDLSNVQKNLATQTTSANDLKAQLAQAEAKVQELTKATEVGKEGKGGKASEEKGKSAEAKKAEPAKAAKKSAKK